MSTVYFIDGSNRAIVNLLKIRWKESLYWEKTSDFSHNSNIRIRPVVQVQVRRFNPIQDDTSPLQYPLHQ
jgi:hypothetical protein